MTQLRPWQEAEASTHALTRRRAILAEPRTGKTLAALESLKRSKYSKSDILVVSPVSFAASWASQLEQVLGVEVTRGYCWSTEKMRKVLEANRKSPRMVCVLTYGQIWRGKFRDELRRRPWKALILDELHRVAAAGSRQARTARLLAWQCEWVRGLTGTPVPAHYGNLWGQMAAINKDQWGTSYGAFASRELILDPMFPSRVLGVRNEDRLLRMVREDACVVTRKEVFGGDSWEYVHRSVELPRSARALYNKLAKEWIANQDGKVVTAEHVLERLIRFQQITSGFIASVGGELVGVHKAKVEAVLDDLSEIVAQREKVVLFHRFRWEHEAYKEAIAALRGARVFGISGDTKAEARSEVERIFNSHKGPAVVVAQIQAASEALSFAEAQHVFFVSTNFSFKDNLQARDRVFKPGETRVVTNFIVKNSVDEFIYRKIGEKVPMHAAIMGGTLREMLGV